MKCAQILESVQLFGHCIYFSVNIYIHANKEIDATKLYRLKNPRTFQDFFLQFYSTNQKSQRPLGQWIITYLSLYTLVLTCAISLIASVWRTKFLPLPIMEGLDSTGFRAGDTLPQMKYVFKPEIKYKVWTLDVVQWKLNLYLI